MSSGQGSKHMMISSPMSSYIPAIQGGGNGQLQNQAPLFIKVKSKTNTNPTR